jgi:hypothetical protein
LLGEKCKVVNFESSILFIAGVFFVKLIPDLFLKEVFADLD